MRAGPSSPFPLALYGSLVLALFVLWARDRFVGIEQRLRGIVVLPLRAYAAFGSEAHAAARDVDPARESLHALGRELASRQARATAALPAELRPAECEPFVCRVLEQRKAPYAKVASILVLDVAPEVAARSLPFVTYGEHLLGFLEALDDGDRVGVALLHRSAERTRPAPRRLVAELELGDAAGSRLRCLVEPARASEPWLLRCLAVEDPYRAATITAGGSIVRTASDEEAPFPIPPGLVVGELRVRGFENEGRAVPIGLYVRPRMQPLGISTVTLWLRKEGAPAPEFLDAGSALLRTHLVHETSLLDLPAPPPTGEAWFLATKQGLRLARGAAVLERGALVGLVQSSGSGYAVAVPIGAAARWSLLWLPAGEARAPVDLVCRALAREGDVVSFEIEGEEAELPGSGTLWTGAMGPHCPPALPIGTVVSSAPEARRFQVRLHGKLLGPFTALARREVRS